MMTCTCLPGNPNPACPEPRRHDATGIDPCAHCGTPKAECVRMVMALSLNGCCTPCDFGPRHESEADLCKHCGTTLNRILAVDDCPKNFHNHNEPDEVPPCD